MPLKPAEDTKPNGVWYMQDSCTDEDKQGIKQDPTGEMPKDGGRWQGCYGSLLEEGAIVLPTPRKGRSNRIVRAAAAKPQWQE